MTYFSSELHRTSLSLLSGPKELEDVQDVLLTPDLIFCDSFLEMDQIQSSIWHGEAMVQMFSPITQMGSWWLPAVVVGRWKEKISSRPNGNLPCKSPLKTQTHVGAVSTEIQSGISFPDTFVFS